MLSRSVLLCAVLCIATSVAMQYDPALIRKYLDSGDSSFQIHVHWTGNPDERMFSYVTPLNASSSIPATYIVYGTDPSFGSNATGNAYEFGTGGHNFYVHNVLVQGLEPDTTYYYSVGSDETGWSDTHTIYTKSDNIVYAVYGDFGFDNDVSLQELIAEVNASTFDAVIHVGDFAYDLDSNNGEVGDAFMAAIQPIASAVPYMVAPGNHEAYENFTHYINRFSGITQGPANISGSGTNLWYSFDQNNVHWIVIDTEVYHYSVDPNEISRQLAWLEQDLIAANDNRQAVPWIIMFGHKFEYMDHTNWTSFWPLAHKYGVDLYFCGHQHNYQRNFPYYNDDIDQQDVNTYTNPKYMVAVVAGSPGCKEKTSSDMNSSDKLAYSSTDYGYGHLTIYNTTHLLWQWEKTGDGKRKELQHHKKKFHDYMWIIQDNHGPRA